MQIMDSTARDRADLSLLGTLHYALGAMIGLFACIPLVHVGLGLAMMLSPQSFSSGGKEPPPFWFGGLFFAIGLAVMVMGWAFAALLLRAGFLLKRARSHTFCMVIAFFELPNVPIGTALGAWTLSVLTRPSVKALFDPPPISRP